MLGDVNGDGRLDLVLMTYLGVFCLDVGGGQPSLLWSVNLTEWSEEGVLPEGAQSSVRSSYQLIADIDADANLEVLILGPYPIVLDGSTGRLETFYLNQDVALGKSQENGAWWGDVDQDGTSEWICELSGWSRLETQIYCLILNGSFPAPSSWPEYYHSAYPAEYQETQDWLTLKSAYSNSLWFPIPDSPWWSVCALLLWTYVSGSTLISRASRRAGA